MRLGLGPALCVACLAAVAGVRAQDGRDLAHVKQLGAALSEYNDGTKSARMNRDSIEIETSTGDVVRLAGYGQWNDDVKRASRLLQAVAPTHRQVRTYFREFATSTPLRFFKAPYGAG